MCGRGSLGSTGSSGSTGSDGSMSSIGSTGSSDSIGIQRKSRSIIITCSKQFSGNPTKISDSHVTKIGIPKSYETNECEHCMMSKVCL